MQILEHGFRVYAPGEKLDETIAFYDSKAGPASGG